ncbi:MAG: diguanylate cyclase [Leptospiraceae bacterium]|nr:diguanylate cyclase [Leptospiraceae bacterium]
MNSFLICEMHMQSINEINITSEIFSNSTLEFREQFFETVVENATDSIIITSASPINGKFPVIVYANKTSTKITGYEVSEIIGLTPRVLQGEKTDKNTLKEISRALKNWETVDVEILNYKKDGTEFWSHLSITPIKDKKGFYTHWVSVQRDVTYKKKIEAEIRYNEERLRTVIKAMNSAVWEWEMIDNTIFWSDKMYEILGIKRNTEFVSFEFALGLIHEDDRQRVLAETRKHLDEGDEFNTEFRMRKANGEYVFLNFTGLAKRDSRNVPYLMTGSATDITIIRANREKIEFLAYHDPLTRLSNRTKLDKLMFELLESNQSKKISFLALAFIDLDGFKKINDTYGHEIGDQVLIEVASRLNQIVTHSDSIFRLGGDEFLLVLRDIQSRDIAIQIIERVKESLFQEYHVQNISCETSGSIGVAFYPEHGENFADLLRSSDNAMYKAKQKGRKQIVIASSS